MTSDMRTGLFIIFFLCLSCGATAGNAGDNGYDDIGGFFEYCSKVKSPGMRYVYISKQMMGKASNLPIGDIDLRSISEKIDFIQSVYVVTGFEGMKLCAQKAENLPLVARDNGFECVMSHNQDGSYTNIYIKSGYGGLNSVLMTNVVYIDGEIEFAVAALIGGVFTHEEILSLFR